MAVALAAGVLLRLLTAYVSVGTNDILSWEKFALFIDQHSLTGLYAADTDFNHPAAMGYYALLVLKAADLTGGSFYFLFKLPVIFADLLCISLIFRVWRGSDARSAAVLYSLSLVAILISSYHGNTDTFYCVLSLLSAWLIEGKNRPLLSGLALGLALNVKLIPVIFVFPLVLSLKTRRDVSRWSAGFAVGIMPLLLSWILIGDSFAGNVFRYKPYLEYWGIPMFLLLSRNNNPEYQGLITFLLNTWAEWSKVLILVFSLAISLAARVTGRFSLYETMALSSAAFLIFAPGFGLQYFAVTGIMLMSCNLIWGLRFSVLAGFAALSAYYYALVSWDPVLSLHYRSVSKGVCFIYSLVWLLLICYLLESIFMRSKMDPEGQARSL